MEGEATGNLFTVVSERIVDSPVQYNFHTTITNTGKCAAFYLNRLRTALEEKRNKVKSHRVDEIKEMISILKACGVEVEVK